TCVPYDFIIAQGGATPQFAVSGTSDEPFAVAFEDEVRLMTSSSSLQSMNTALNDSISGMGGSEPLTGVAYIVADKSTTDPENAPIFKSRATPYRIPGQTVIGQVVAFFSGASWTILETTSYRPGALYDSAWIPILADDGVFSSGRAVPGFDPSSTEPTRVYFHHQLGPEIDIHRASIDLYLAAPSSPAPGDLSTGWNQTHAVLYSFMGQDERVGMGLSGGVLRVPVSATRTSAATDDREASIFYLDGNIVGLSLNPELIEAYPYSGSDATPQFNYLRLVMRRDA
ncbi:MAG: hypothetical protein ACXABY_02985, partial [Candidatus Thorarchaeota archaeon]